MQEYAGKNSNQTRGYEVDDECLVRSQLEADSEAEAMAYLESTQESKRCQA